MKISVKCPSGHFVSLVVANNQNVCALKNKIESTEHIPIECQRLIFQGKQLEDAYNLVDSGLEQGCTVFLHTRLRGGMQAAGAAASSQKNTLRHDSEIAKRAADEQEKNRQPETEAVDDDDDDETDTLPQTLAEASMKEKIWIILSEPTVCKEAKWMLYAINIFILLSFISITLSTLPNLQTDSWKTFFFIVNTFFIAIFVIDFVLRLFCAPDLALFLKDGMTWIDFLSTFSFFPALIWPDSRILGFLRIMRTLRHIRFFRARPTFVILTTLTHDLKQATTALVAPMYFMFLVLILLGAMEYFAEKAYESSLEEWESYMIDSIPMGLWWGIVTMSGVGYGDKSPNSIAGKLVAAFTAFVGVFFIAMPFAVSGGSFWHAWSVYQQGLQPSYEELAKDEDFNEEEYFGFQKKKTIKLMKAMYAWMDPVATLGETFKEVTEENKDEAIEQLVNEIENLYKLQEDFESELLNNMDAIIDDDAKTEEDNITSIGGLDEGVKFE